MDVITKLTVADNIILFCHADRYKNEPFHQTSFKPFEKPKRHDKYAIFEPLGMLDFKERLDPFIFTFTEGNKKMTDIYCVFSKAQSGNIISNINQFKHHFCPLHIYSNLYLDSGLNSY